MYEYVTEDQYADIVNDRIARDWVVGDVASSGYAETGKYIMQQQDNNLQFLSDHPDLGCSGYEDVKQVMV